MAQCSYPCPICGDVMTIIGKATNGKKLTSCNHLFKFKRTRSEKYFDKKYIKTEDGGYELIRRP